MREFLSKLRGIDIQLRLVEGELTVKYPKGKIDNAILDEIRSKKLDLIAYLTLLDQYQYADIPVIDSQPSYPLSSSQRRLWILNQLEDGSVAYNIPNVYVFEGELDIIAIECSFNSLLERHEILRTAFREDEKGEIRQFILSKEELYLHIPCHDLRNIDNQPEELKSLIRKEYGFSFDLTAGAPIRGVLFQVEDHKWVFTCVMHHIISDGWSMRILIRELLLFYNAHHTKTLVSLSPLRIQYKDYACWQQEQIGNKSLAIHRDYWLKQFEGNLPVLELPGDKIRPAIKSYNGSIINSVISTETATGLKLLLQEQGATLFMGLLAIVNTLLYRYTGQEDLIIGSPIAGREHIDLEDQIGFYVNTLALRSQFKGTDSYKELLAHVKRVTLEAYEHQAYPFDELLEALQLQRDMSHSALFDVMVVFQKSEEEDAKSQRLSKDLSVSSYAGDENLTNKFDLTFTFSETAGQISISLGYNTDIFSEDTVNRYINHLNQLTAQVIKNPDLDIKDLDYLNRQEKDVLLTGFNAVEATFPRDKTIVDLFQEQVTRTPDHIALEFENTVLTYNELNERSNRLANYLRATYQIEADDLIGVMLDRSELMIISTLGILKSGGAYVPIDPEYPQDRIEYILADINCKVVIDQEELKSFTEIEHTFNLENLQPVNKPDDLAYVIYTSGTTGNPKGALINHYNVVQLLKPDQFLFDFNASDIWPMFHSYCFDWSVWEMYGALFYGGKLIIIPTVTAKDPNEFRKLLVDKRVTVLNQTPSAFYNLIPQILETAENNLALRYVIFGGEALSPGKLKLWRKSYPKVKLINMYGITETTVHVTYKEIKEKEIEGGLSNIGVPLPTLTCYVLDRYRNLLPVGILGELYVGGNGVCRGYLNREDLTKQRFVDSPFKEGDRLYRSGDMVRILSNGEIEYLGRVDDQVKIRGYRIELGEVENALQSNPDVSSSIVIVKSGNDGEKELVAYVVSEKALNTIYLKLYLGGILPAYMVPSHFIQLDKIPLTSNGKVDRKKLPNPEGFSMATGAEYVAARNVVEQHLVEVVEEVLKKHHIGVKENFFILGGDSIKSIQVISRLKKRGYGLSIRDVLQYPVIEDLALRVKTVNRTVDQGVVEGVIPLGPIQTLFFENNITDRHHFNQSVLLRSKESISTVGLQASLDYIGMHHDALRMSYREIEGEFVQENKGITPGYSLEVIENADDIAFAAHCDRIQTSIDLEKGPLFKVALFRGLKVDRILLVIHHLVVDGVSWRILFEDLSTLYQQFLSGQTLRLPLKTESFHSWQQEQLQYALSEEFKKEEPYWSSVASAEISPLPKDYQVENNLVKDAVTDSFLLDEELTNLLLTKCHKAYGTDINDILLTALSLSLNEIFEMDRVLVMLEGHGREYIGRDVDVSRTVGWFTTMYPVIFNMDYQSNLIRQLIEVKENLHRVPNKGIGYGILRFLTKNIDRPNPEIIFNYLGDFGSGIKTDGGEELFEFDGGYHGKSISGERSRDAVLDFSGMIASGQLRFSIVYNAKHYSSSTIKVLIKSFQQQLKALIRQLSQEQKIHLSPVDLTYKGLSVEELQELNKIL